VLGFVPRGGGFVGEMEAPRSLPYTNGSWRYTIIYTDICGSTDRYLIIGSKFERNLPAPILDRESLYHPINRSIIWGLIISPASTIMEESLKRKMVGGVCKTGDGRT
jgi:hypothetical protein